MCECSHPFTTITQTSQASGSEHKPIHPDDKRCLHSGGFLPTEKHAHKFDLCFRVKGVKAVICSAASGNRDDPVNLFTLSASGQKKE